ncbi:hypothetical protein RA269_27965, partial [Pseudomonas syringae pv. tagetis]|uniref:hypothetical protein n=1 Tax=Pseudomonas syringae group genomosp. 7 TaxID=251699 RepID=UPI00376FEC25
LVLVGLVLVVGGVVVFDVLVWWVVGWVGVVLLFVLWLGCLCYVGGVWCWCLGWWGGCGGCVLFWGFCGCGVCVCWFLVGLGFCFCVVCVFCHCVFDVWDGGGGGAGLGGEVAGLWVCGVL